MFDVCLVFSYSLEAQLFTRCLLLVEIHLLFFFKSLVTRFKSCRSYSLQKVTRYSLQKLLVAKNHSLLVAKFARYSLQKFIVAKNYSLLVAKFTRYLLHNLLIEEIHSLFVAKLARYLLQKFLVAKNHSLLVAKFTRYTLQKLLVEEIHSLLVGNSLVTCRCSLQKIICYLLLNSRVTRCRSSSLKKFTRYSLQN